MPKHRIMLYLGTIALLLFFAIGWYAIAFVQDVARAKTAFDGSRALRDVQQQVAFGPRVPGSDGHVLTANWIETELAAAGWSVDRHSAKSMGHPVLNLVASRSTAQPYILVGAHYDTRIHADRDPVVERRAAPSPGANDGASGVAVLLELARSLPPETTPIRLVFFDAEDNGRIPGWNWALGSRAFVAEYAVLPQRMVLVDMVGDHDPRFPMEAGSDPDLRTSIWNTAARLGHDDVFLPQVGKAILDDHVPFLEAGIPAVDIIDLDYEYWHTTLDTPDKVSSQTLQVVGDVLWTWLVEQDISDQ